MKPIWNLQFCKIDAVHPKVITVATWSVVMAALIVGCAREHPLVYVIPRTTATLFWEGAHTGALQAGRERGYRIYWNAATRDDDVERQIALLQRAEDKVPAGVVVAPSHATALITVVRDLLAAKIPVVVFESPLPIPSSDWLEYVVPDHHGAGQAIGRKVQEWKTNSAVALVGVNPDVTANTELRRGIEAEFELTKSSRISVVRYSRFNRQETEEQVENLLKGGQIRVDVVVALDISATAGSLDALRKLGLEKQVRLIGCGQDGTLQEPLASGEVSAMLVEDTYREGYIAVQAIAERRRTGHWPPMPKIQSRLITSADLKDGTTLPVFELTPER